MRTAERHGIRAVERAVYELLEWDGQTIRVDLTLDIGANPQTTGGGDRVTVLARVAETSDEIDLAGARPPLAEAEAAKRARRIKSRLLRREE